MKIFLLKGSTFTSEINFRKPCVNNITDALFDVCEHWAIDQSQRSGKWNFFQKIVHFPNDEIEFRNSFLLKADFQTNHSLAKGSNLHKFRNKFLTWRSLSAIFNVIMLNITMTKLQAPEGFEPSISCLLGRRFNQLSHRATSGICCLSGNETKRRYKTHF